MKTHTAPASPLSRGPPTSAVSPSADERHAAPEAAFARLFAAGELRALLEQRGRAARQTVGDRGAEQQQQREQRNGRRAAPQRLRFGWEHARPI